MPGYGTDIGFADYIEANGLEIPAGTVAAARLRGPFIWMATITSAGPESHRRRRSGTLMAS